MWGELGNSTKVNIGRGGALNQTKRDTGIPRSQQPDRVYNERTGQYQQYNSVQMTRNNRPIKDSQGNVIYSREYQFTKGDGSKVIIQDHSSGHNFNEGGIGDQGSHFNVRPSNKPRNGYVPVTKKHYPFDK